MSEERKTNKTDPAQVKPGHLMAIIHYVTVKTVFSDQEMSVTPLHGGTDIRVQGRELITNALSADYFAETVPVTRTEMIKLFCTSPNRPLTVVFHKKPKKNETEGEERTLRGRWLSEVEGEGRSFCEDLEKADPKDRIREVDHRTLKKLVVDGVCYVLKKK